MIVDPEEAGHSLLDFLKNRLSFSGKQAKKLIDAGAVTLNGKAERMAKMALHSGDCVLVASEEAHDTPAFSDVEILHDEEGFLAINKPSGIICSPENCFFPKNLSLVHRLDQYTTGVLLLAKTKEAEKMLKEAFKKRSVKKVYLALVYGTPKKKKGLCKSFLQQKWQNRFGSAPEGDYAETRWEVAEAYNESSLIRCYPKTGRTHQIRVHLSEMGHPLVADSLYGGKQLPCLKISNYLLHAEVLEIQGRKIHASRPQIFTSIR